MMLHPTSSRLSTPIRGSHTLMEPNTATPNPLATAVATSGTAVFHTPTNHLTSSTSSPYHGSPTYNNNNNNNMHGVPTTTATSAAAAASSVTTHRLRSQPWSASSLRADVSSILPVHSTSNVMYYSSDDLAAGLGGVVRCPTVLRHHRSSNSEEGDVEEEPAAVPPTLHRSSMLAALPTTSSATLAGATASTLRHNTSDAYYSSAASVLRTQELRPNTAETTSSMMVGGGGRTSGSWVGSRTVPFDSTYAHNTAENAPAPTTTTTPRAAVGTSRGLNLFARATHAPRGSSPAVEAALCADLPPLPSMRALQLRGQSDANVTTAEAYFTSAAERSIALLHEFYSTKLALSSSPPQTTSGHVLVGDVRTSADQHAREAAFLAAKEKTSRLLCYNAMARDAYHSHRMEHLRAITTPTPSAMVMMQQPPTSSSGRDVRGTHVDVHAEKENWPCADIAAVKARFVAGTCAPSAGAATHPCRTTTTTTPTRELDDGESRRARALLHKVRELRQHTEDLTITLLHTCGEWQCWQPHATSSMRASLFRDLFSMRENVAAEMDEKRAVIGQRLAAKVSRRGGGGASVAAHDFVRVFSSPMAQRVPPPPPYATQMDMFRGLHGELQRQRIQPLKTKHLNQSMEQYTDQDDDDDAVARTATTHHHQPRWISASHRRMRHLQQQREAALHMATRFIPSAAAQKKEDRVHENDDDDDDVVVDDDADISFGHLRHDLQILTQQVAALAGRSKTCRASPTSSPNDASCSTPTKLVPHAQPISPPSEGRQRLPRVRSVEVGVQHGVPSPGATPTRPTTAKTSAATTPVRYKTPTPNSKRNNNNNNSTTKKMMNAPATPPESPVLAGRSSPQTTSAVKVPSPRDTPKKVRFSAAHTTNKMSYEASWFPFLQEMLQAQPTNASSITCSPEKVVVGDDDDDDSLGVALRELRQLLLSMKGSSATTAATIRAEDIMTSMRWIEEQQRQRRGQASSAENNTNNNNAAPPPTSVLSWLLTMLQQRVAAVAKSRAERGTSSSGSTTSSCTHSDDVGGSHDALSDDDDDDASYTYTDATVSGAQEMAAPQRVRCRRRHVRQTTSPRTTAPNNSSNSTNNKMMMRDVVVRLTSTELVAPKKKSWRRRLSFSPRAAINTPITFLHRLLTCSSKKNKKICDASAGEGAGHGGKHDMTAAAVGCTPLSSEEVVAPV